MHRSMQLNAVDDGQSRPREPRARARLLLGFLAWLTVVPAGRTWGAYERHVLQYASALVKLARLAVATTESTMG